MCCEPGGMGRSSAAWACGPENCCVNDAFVRRFFSEKEKKDCLEAYRDQLEKELTGVRERIKDLEGE